MPRRRPDSVGGEGDRDAHGRARPDTEPWSLYRHIGQSDNLCFMDQSQRRRGLVVAGLHPPSSIPAGDQPVEFNIATQCDERRHASRARADGGNADPSALPYCRLHRAAAARDFKRPRRCALTHDRDTGSHRWRKGNQVATADPDRRCR